MRQQYKQVYEIALSHKLKNRDRRD
jgi:hypothetical protein